MLRRAAIFLARALAALPILAWEVCRATGKMILAAKQAISPGAIPTGGPDLVSDVGAAAEDAVEQLAPVRRDVPSTVETVQAWCASKLMPGKPVPDLRHLPLPVQLWLAGLDDTEVRALYKKPASSVSAHVEGMYVIAGVPPVTPIPTVREPAPLNLEAIARRAWSEVVDEIQAAPTPHYVGV
jgi:hypothetical protein